MSGDLARALLHDLDDETLAVLAARLRPHLVGQPCGPGSLLTVDEAAQAAGVSGRTVRRALLAGLLEGEQAAGRWRVTPAALERWRAAGAPARSTPRPVSGRRHPRSPEASSAADAILGRKVA
jgi:excisionase family DNA binding protein